jgi:flagellar biosynthesis/type III secretory pathway ATPase
VRGIVDGHIILSRTLAARNHWPAVDVLSSLSRVMDNVVDAAHARAASACRDVLAAYEEKRDLISLGAYEYGSDPDVDYAIDLIGDVESLLQQGIEEWTEFEEARQRLLDLFG